MTHTHRIALLEDSNRQLEKLQSYLSTIPHVDLVLKCSNSEDLLVEAQTVHPEILVTDLKLLNDSMNGLEVAEDLKIPVMFIGDVKEYVREIENLKRDADICVDHITKPFSEEQFVKSFKRFLQEVNFFSPPQYVHLDFNKKKHKVLIDDIVYLCANKNESNNKEIHFINRPKANLVDFSFIRMEEFGLMNSQFVTIHKSFRVNKKYIKSYDSKTEKIELSVFDDHGKYVQIKVSENYQPVIRKTFG
ncbi:LytR/AlgR family response regulator transcription factor [Epilithonimonas vandammei]|uniref:LytR/AlgR family response regulator transcription factor n=1 Tax=Epilithonimonas vandammei TaxID=2487072 RepID=UPI0028A5EBFF|nr:LytTR family transcriptional regulator DNA-binding domain-containing protein [Epilithonimonas vandammei]